MGTHYQGTASEVEALSAYINLIRSVDSLTGRLTLFTQHGLTESQFGVLEALLHIGPMCQKELATKLLKSGGNITMVIDNLEKQQLVERHRDTKDRRFITVHLTDKGRALISEIFPRHAAAVAAEMGVLSGDEQLQLRNLCRKLGKGHS
jgi:MarR family 2-MHQ and catechol resistance regulon transcriptional repressor